MFCVWSKMPLNNWEGYKKVLDVEIYPDTFVDTKWKLYKEFIKQKFKK